MGRNSISPVLKPSDCTYTDPGIKIFTQSANGKYCLHPDVCAQYSLTHFLPKPRFLQLEELFSDQGDDTLIIEIDSGLNLCNTVFLLVLFIFFDVATLMQCLVAPHLIPPLSLMLIPPHLSISLLPAPPPIASTPPSHKELI